MVAERIGDVALGAGAGVGRAASILFAREGTAVAVSGIGADRASSVAGEILDAGGTWLPLRFT